MSKKIVFVFPGQGSQALGMLSAFVPEYPLIQETFAEASAVLNKDLWKLCQKGPAETLNQTENTQPALLAASVALWKVYRQKNGVLPLFMAGHSLGEYSALVCAGSLEFTTAIRLVAERGRLMQNAVPFGTGAMAAIVGLEDTTLQELCDSLRNGQVLSPANYNSIGQTVVAGTSEAVDRLVEQAKKAGAKLAKRIPVSVPSHCALMLSAAERLANYLNEITFLSPQFKIINNVDVKIEETSQAIKSALVRQLFNPVRWVETIQWLEKQAIDTLVECGPGKVLAGLNKRITSIPTLSIQDPETLQRALIA
ncbi:MAG: ACP S-malonyltransferase [Rickettsiella sp.]|nr:ACP S-malonyltransferase [Rickettsiella sp.]